ncbi:hypothetical protein [Pseudomonas sp.]|uniref:hypothetical protein n=1 Tax=Pseudomonas sp. TaxID=306 RepID=UPI0023533F5B|nr:hypothetical protein [Pseudomonas sp.]
MLFKHLLDDLLHAQLLENPVVDAMREVRKAWDQGQAVMGQALAGTGAGDALNLAMNAVTGEKGWSLPMRVSWKRVWRLTVDILGSSETEGAPHHEVTPRQRR